ncbi:MAG: type II secretion system protein GspG [Planctomycetaceae bacterium]|nr:type II secretion system protein GspG [Planctomycetaceae bacterium]
MNTTKLFYRQGFTLVELLIVLGILLALLAILIPGLFSAQARSRIQQAKIQIRQLEGYLESYATENRGYPTTEQGLYALIYFPDNQIPGLSPSLAQPSGMSPAGMDPNAAFGGNAMAVGGAGTFGAQPGIPMNPMSPANPMGTSNSMMDPTGMGMANPMSGTMGNPAGMSNPMDSMGGMATANPMDPMSGMATTVWNQPVHNPQIYTQQRKRPTPYIDSEKSLVDPWGQPYRYDNSMQYNGLNRTGEAKPAIWSAGPDKRDGTEDDILSWDSNEAQQRIAQQQQLQQFQGGMGTTNPMDMMGNTMGNPIDPTGAGMMNPPMAPAGMSNQPPAGMVNPMGTGGAMNPMNETGIPQPPMMPNPMPTPTPMPANPMPNPMPPTPTQP